MGRNGFLILIFLILIVPEVFNASVASQLRSLAGDAPIDNSTVGTSIPPVPSSVPVNNNSKNEPVNADKPNMDVPKDTQEHNNSSKTDPISSNSTGLAIPPTSKEKNGTENNTKTVILDNCDKVPNRCTDIKQMVACIFEGSTDLAILVHNEGESTLKVNLSVPTSSQFVSKELTIPKHQNEKINISSSLTDYTKIVLNAGNKECVLHVGSAPTEKFFNRLPSYSEFTTPIYGAYLLIVITLIFGGSWACCKLCKKRQQLDGGVPYQELEMGLADTNPTVHVETAEGWDQGWDDDWDDDKAVKTSGSLNLGGISGNGLVSRSPKKDGWENDWDD